MNSLINKINKDDAVFTIELYTLINSGLLDWSSDEWFWRGVDYDEQTAENKQHDRICKMFNEKYRYREIGVLPFKRWKTRLLYRIQYELVPKYKPLYDELKDGMNPLAIMDEYEKRRDIESGYPETLLSGNADYLTSGLDHEHEKIINGDTVEQMTKYATMAKSIDQMFIDELDSMFIQLYTSTLNIF